MISLDRLAMIWSVVIVVIAVGFAFDGSISENTYDVNSNDAIPKNAVADIINPVQSSIHLETDKDTYTEDDIVVVSGKVSEILQDTVILLVVYDSFGETVTMAQVHMNGDGEFTKKIPLERSSWLQNGTYTIKVHYGDDVIANTEFTFTMNLEDGKTV